MGTGQFSRFSPALIAVIAIVAAVLTFVIPVADGVDNPAAAHWRTAVVTVITALFVGAAIIFLIGLRGFKTELRTAYRLLAIGIILFSLSLLQMPVAGLFNLWETPWIDSGGAILPFAMATVFMYAGMRKFARLLQIRTRLNSVWVVIALVTIFMVLSGVVAHYLVQYAPLDGADAYIAVVGWTGGFAVAAALLARKITRAIGEHYHSSMRWLEIAFWSLSAAAAHEYTTTFYFNNGDAFTDYGWYVWPFVAAGILLVRASYAFLALTAQDIAVKTPAQPKEADDRDYIDSIVSVAGLASRPEEVDLILDDLRKITIMQKPGESLSGEQERQLVNVYDRLERYLSGRDPLRSFSKEEVRQHVTPAFRAVIGSQR
jgi:hypothetical protein